MCEVRGHMGRSGVGGPAIMRGKFICGHGSAAKGCTVQMMMMVMGDDVGGVGV